MVELPTNPRWTVVTWSRSRAEADRDAAPWLGCEAVEGIVHCGPELDDGADGETPRRCFVRVPHFLSDAGLRSVAAAARGEWLAIVNTPGVAAPREPFFRRLAQAFCANAWDCLYSHYTLTTAGGAPETVVLPPFQAGSARDTFPFGPLLAFRTAAFRAASESKPATGLLFAALQRVIGELAARQRVGRVPETLYEFAPPAPEDRESAHFAYLSREQVVRQREMEAVFTEHLRRIGAWLPPPPSFDPDREKSGSGRFPVTASVIIPVRNRVHTVEDAVESAARQETRFPFNVLVVDNHSNDGTSSVVAGLAARLPHVVHLVPPEPGRGIGGCWQYAVQSPQCGRWAVQLDSDDLYAAPDSLARMVACLRETPCAFAVGSYRLVDEDLVEVPPGLIDHREWTPENGHNNLLRVEGIGAPRAFDVSALRRVGFPDVSYGEDYAVALALSREFQVGRIFEAVYLCRRWSGNSDSRLTSAQAAAHHEYKDFLRSGEILRRRTNPPIIG